MARGHKDEIKEYKRTYDEENRDLARAYQRKNAERIRVKNSEWRGANADHLKAYRTRHRNSNADHIKAKRREYRETLSIGYVAGLLKMKVKTVPEDMLELKRSQIKLGRLLNKIEGKGESYGSEKEK